MGGNNIGLLYEKDSSTVRYWGLHQWEVRTLRPLLFLNFFCDLCLDLCEQYTLKINFCQSPLADREVEKELG